MTKQDALSREMSGLRSRQAAAIPRPCNTHVTALTLPQAAAQEVKHSPSPSKTEIQDFK